MHADLPRLGLEDEAGDADDVTDVILAEVRELLLRHRVLADVELDLAAVVLNVAEDGFAHAALGHDAAGDGDLLFVEAVEIGLDLGGIRGAHKARLLEGVAALVLQRLELVAPDLQELREVLLGRGGGSVGFVGHISFFPLAGNS